MQIGISSIKHNNSPLHLIRNICLSHVGVGVMHTVYFVKCFSIRRYFGGIYTPTKCRELSMLFCCPALLWVPHGGNSYKMSDRGSRAEAGRSHCSVDGRVSRGTGGARKGWRHKAAKGLPHLSSPTPWVFDWEVFLQMRFCTKSYISFLIFKVFTFKEVKIIISSSRHPQRSSEMAIYK